jgi:GH25 family lysozyme M1 (1,4-beta-N-acetylmuramidase)
VAVTVFGIDISDFQHGLSLAAVKRQGYEFVIAKATQGRGVPIDWGSLG